MKKYLYLYKLITTKISWYLLIVIQDNASSNIYYEKENASSNIYYEKDTVYSKT